MFTSVIQSASPVLLVEECGGSAAVVGDGWKQPVASECGDKPIQSNQILQSVATLVVLFLGFVGVAYALMQRLLVLSPDLSSSLMFPTSLQDAHHLAVAITTLLHPHTATTVPDGTTVTLSSSFQTELYVNVVLLFAVVYICKQTFSIPGSAVLNMLAGALFGSLYGGMLVLVLTVSGASFCYFLSALAVGRHLLPLFGVERVQWLASIIQQQREQHNLFFYLLFLRMFPFTPNWFLNLTSPLVRIPYFYFMWSICLGLAPYCFLTCHAGTLLTNHFTTTTSATSASINSFIFDRSSLLLLVGLSVSTLAPIAFKRKFQVL